jgi:hypothetical protein
VSPHPWAQKGRALGASGGKGEGVKGVWVGCICGTVVIMDSAWAMGMALGVSLPRKYLQICNWR